MCKIINLISVLITLFILSMTLFILSMHVLYLKFDNDDCLKIILYKSVSTSYLIVSFTLHKKEIYIVDLEINYQGKDKWNIGKTVTGYSMENLTDVFSTGFQMLKNSYGINNILSDLENIPVLILSHSHNFIIPTQKLFSFSKYVDKYEYSYDTFDEMADECKYFIDPTTKYINSSYDYICQISMFFVLLIVAYVTHRILPNA